MYEYSGWSGAYLSLGCLIRLKDNVFFDDCKLNGNALPLLLHEYTHWIQDVGTISGWVHYLHTFIYHQEFANAMGDKKVVSLPLRTKYWSELETLHSDTNPEEDYFEGDTNITFLGFDYESQWRPLHGDNVEVGIGIMLFKHNLNSKVHRIPFGVREIRENYAAAVTEISGGRTMEERSAKPTAKHYWIIKYALNKIFGDDFGAKQLIAICHYALNHPYPSEGFVIIVEHLRNVLGGKCPDEGEAIAFAKECIAQSCVRTGGYAQLAALLGIRDQWLRDFPRTLMTEAFVWLCGIIEKIFRLTWESDTPFPLSMPYMTLDRRNTTDTENRVTNSFLEIRPPLIMQPDRIVAITDDRLEHSIMGFLASLNVFRQFLTGYRVELDCPFFNVCRIAANFKVADHCRVTPWDRGVFREKCMMGNAAAYLGIHDRTFTLAE